MKTISLNGKWKLTGRMQNHKCDEPISLTATVPGCVQLDLSEHGYLPNDLFMGENILKAEEFENYEWWYERSFTAPKERKNVFLVFEGVDCIAEYFLNGIKLGESDNMFIAHEFKIDDFLKDDENILTVHIKSAVLEANTKDYTLKVLASSRNMQSRHIRKAPHSYGWDIMPRLVTAGLWREVKLEVRDIVYFSQTFFNTHNDWNSFSYVLEGDLDNFNDLEIELSGSCGEDSSFSTRVACRENFGRFGFDIKNRKKWFPYGYGDANVYDGTAKIFSQGKLVHEEKISFGVRNVVLKRQDPKDNNDGEFRIFINGVEILCKGSNWLPLDAFHCRDAQRYEEALSLAKDIGCNILRCWGGNVYEDHYFFDFCDRNGIMVWQDFAMACAIYPEDEEFKKKIEKEAVSVIRKIRNHPSVILWSGDNEVDSGNPGCNPDNNTITREVLPKCVELNDIGRPYLPSSPYITREMHSQGNLSQVIGSRLVEDHLWGPRDYFKSDFYKNNNAQFVSETGYHGCPDLESIKKFITPDQVWPYDNPEWILHSTNQDGNNGRVMLMEKQIKQLFGEVPEKPEEYILASQISQAEAKKYFIERIRVDRPQKTGIIWWNLLDGWPQMSDAVVDYYFTKKLAYYYIKRSQAPFAICADEIKSWNLDLYACNDTLQEEKGTLIVKDALTDKIIYEGSFTAKENTATLIASLPTYYSEHKFLIFEWETHRQKGFNHYLCGYPPISLDMYKDALQKYNLRR